LACRAAGQRWVASVRGCGRLGCGAAAETAVLRRAHAGLRSEPVRWRQEGGGAAEQCSGKPSKSKELKKKQRTFCCNRTRDHFELSCFIIPHTPLHICLQSFRPTCARHQQQRGRFAGRGRSALRGHCGQQQQQQQPSARRYWGGNRAGSQSGGNGAGHGRGRGRERVGSCVSLPAVWSPRSHHVGAWNSFFV